VNPAQPTIIGNFRAGGKLCFDAPPYLSEAEPEICANYWGNETEDY
jgi:hypothetical protein